MAKIKATIPIVLFSLLVTFIFAAYAIQESRSEVVVASIPPTQSELLIQGNKMKIKMEATRKMKKSGRRLMIGSTAPICTYNECRGCRYKCRAEQVPVEGNDPINSAYHYRCVCHR